MATIDDAGAAIKTLQEYLGEIKQSYLDIDEGWNINPESPDGMAIRIWSELLANLDEQLNKAYASVDPDSAVGVQLDRIARLSGLTRQAGTPSTATVTFSGTDGTTIPEGTEVRNTETGTNWATDQDATISGGDIDVGVTCTINGPEPAAVNTLTEIVNPVGGVTGVTNSAPAVLGEARESDNNLRIRLAASVSAPAQNQVDSMFANLFNVNKVTHVKVYENFTGSTDSNGLNPHSLGIFVQGGDTTEISKSIANQKNPGTNLNADQNFGGTKVQENVQTERGSDLQVTFFRPDLQSIYVTVNVDAPNGLNSQTIQAIKDNIVAYSNAGLFNVAVEGFDRTGFTIGEVVKSGKLYTPVNKAIGDSGTATQITLSETNGGTQVSSIDPGFDGLAVFDTDNITVNVT